MRYGKPYSSIRRDSGTSEDFLTVESAILRANNGGPSGVGIGKSNFQFRISPPDGDYVSQLNLGFSFFY